MTGGGGVAPLRMTGGGRAGARLWYPQPVILSERVRERIEESPSGPERGYCPVSGLRAREIDGAGPGTGSCRSNRGYGCGTLDIAMTYNFDPEAWLERQRAAVEARNARGEIDDAKLAEELEELDRRYDDMVARLDGTYAIPADEA